MSRRCKAQSTRTGQQCKKNPLKGAEVCLAHGGGAPQVRRKAAQRHAEAQAMEALNREGSAPVANPLEALQALAGEVLTVKDYLGKRVEVLEELRYRGMGGEQIRGELVAYERALDRSIRALESIARLNIDERLAKVSEAQVAMMTDAVDWSIRALLDLPAPGRVRRDPADVQYDLGNLVRKLLGHALRNPGHAKPALPEDIAGRVESHRQRWEDARRLADVEAENEELRDKLAANKDELDEMRDRLALALATRSLAPLAIEPPRPVEVLTDGQWQVPLDADVVDGEIIDEPTPRPRRQRKPDLLDRLARGY